MKLQNKERQDIKYFIALSDVLLNSVKRQTNDISKTLSRFFYGAFREERNKFIDKPVVYPEAYYLLIYNTIEELAILKNKKNYALEYRTIGGVWLLGEMERHEISETTYTWLWRNILLAVKYEQDDMILYYWEVANQYFTYSLKYIQREYDRGSFTIKNNDEITKRNKERERFLELQYFLGGLLLYEKRYSCISRLFTFTNSEPPSYELLPSTMDEIFTQYIKFIDPYERKFTTGFSMYSFPKQNGIYSEKVIKRWVCSYLAILFLRQYTIVPHMVYQKPLNYPAIPSSQSEKKDWIDRLDFFKKLVSEILENTELIKT